MKGSIIIKLYGSWNVKWLMACVHSRNRREKKSGTPLTVSFYAVWAPIPYLGCIFPFQSSLSWKTLTDMPKSVSPWWFYVQSSGQRKLAITASLYHLTSCLTWQTHFNSKSCKHITEAQMFLWNSTSYRNRPLTTSNQWETLPTPITLIFTFMLESQFRFILEGTEV